MILREVESQMREQLRFKLEAQGFNLDQMNLLEDFDLLSVNFDDDDQSRQVFYASRHQDLTKDFIFNFGN